jgi:hypothetical protein
MTKFSVLAGTAVMAMLVAAPAFAEDEIGQVFAREFRGAEGTRTTGETRELRWHGPVYAEETVRTEAGENTELEFVDQTHLSVGANSEVVLDSFVYDPGQGTGDAVITFGKGVFRFVSGEMNKDGYKLNTPSATLAVRGTIFQLLIDAVNNVIVYVEQGAVEIYPCNNEQGLVEAGESAFITARCEFRIRDGNYIIDPIEIDRVDETDRGGGGDDGGNTDGGD